MVACQRPDGLHQLRRSTTEQAGARAQGRSCAPAFSTVSKESMNRHVAEASWLTDQSPAEENTWGHHQQRAWAVWLGKARLRAAQGMSARDGWVQTRKSGTIGSSAGAQRPHPWRKKAAAWQSIRHLGRFDFETLNGENRHLCSHCCCDHTLCRLAGPKHWPQDGAPGGMRWGMAQDRVAAPQTRCYRPRERYRRVPRGYRLACASHSHGNIRRHFAC